MNEKEQMKLDMVKNLALLLMSDDQSIQMADALEAITSYTHALERKIS